MVSTNKTNNDQMSISFAGCGFLGLYHIGVASCLKNYAPVGNRTLLVGTSAGALAATSMCLNLSLVDVAATILSVATDARTRSLGAFDPSFDVNRILHDKLDSMLPNDCHTQANGRLVIGMTRVADGKNVLISQFDSKQDLIDAIKCSSFIPLWSGILPPKFQGIAYIDGGFTDNLPVIDKHTITVTPFSGQSDICPLDDMDDNNINNKTNNSSLYGLNMANFSLTLTNLYRGIRTLFPAHPEAISRVCQQGFDDALRYLRQKNKIACTRGLAIKWSLITVVADGGGDTDKNSVKGD
ncbi:patatin-like phospholipase domain-containing protein 2 [Oppia nitens]|uniref:patatin-like phospholipase domain-containing protein 2 n=1 Tax=Oppia nitens TaxID=1686743 RepID=UPI0023DAB44F|nr:patatin-like phospholipase domain-containing protein 2 [Oppia nitens]